jgi:hypothetical protein
MALSVLQTVGLTPLFDRFGAKTRRLMPNQPWGSALTSLVQHINVDKPVLPIYDVFNTMPKITTGAKAKSSSLASLRHLIYQNPQHEKDRKKAQILRSRQSTAPIKLMENSKEIPSFPRASEVAFLVGISDQKTTVFDPTSDPISGSDLRPEVVDFWHKIHHERAFYFRKDKKKKDGTFYEKKTQTNGVKECTISLPIGWTKVLKTAIETGLKSPAQLSQELQEIGQLLLQEMHSRTGYEPLFLTLHPDSETNLQFHLGLGSIDPETHKLLGRSGSGERGKASIREAGTCFLNVWRNAKKAKLNPQQLERFEKENLSIPRMAFKNSHTDWDGNSLKSKDGLPLSYDDVALAVKLETLLEERFPELAKTAEEVGVDYATNWVIQILKSGRTRADLKQYAESKDEQIASKDEQLSLKDEQIAHLKLDKTVLQNEVFTVHSEKSALSEETEKKINTLKAEKSALLVKQAEQMENLMLAHQKEITDLKNYPAKGLSNKQIDGLIQKLKDAKENNPADPPV